MLGSVVLNKQILLFLLTISFSMFTVSQQANIGVVDLQAAISSSNVAKAEFQKLKADASYKKLTDKIKSLQKELQALQKEGETKSLTWSDAQKKQHVQKGQAKLNEFNQLANQEANARGNLTASLEQTLGPKIEKIVNDIIADKNIGLLLNSQAVYFRTADFDITEEVVKRLNSGN